MPLGISVCAHVCHLSCVSCTVMDCQPIQGVLWILVAQWVD